MGTQDGPVALLAVCMHVIGERVEWRCKLVRNSLTGSPSNDAMEQNVMH